MDFTEFLTKFQVQAYVVLGIAMIFFIILAIAQQSVVGVILAIGIPVCLAVGIAIATHLQEIGEALESLIVKTTGGAGAALPIVQLFHHLQ